MSSNPNINRVIDALSSKHWDLKFLSEDNCPLDLITALSKNLPHIAQFEWPERLLWGGTFVNGLEITENMVLRSPCRVEYYEPKYDFRAPEKQFPDFHEDYVLYNDGELVFIFKPAGIACFQAREQRKVYLKGQLEDFFKAKIHMPSRLDTSVSGLMAISIKPGFHDRLQKIYEKRLIQKHYLLLVEGTPPWDAKTVDAPIGRDMEHPVLRKVVGSEGKSAQTQLKKINSGKFTLSSGKEVDVTLLKAKPVTGRTHQIRIHAAHVEYPIIGDNFYAGAHHDNLLLLSYAVRFRRPITGEAINFKLPEKYVPSWCRSLMPKN